MRVFDMKKLVLLVALFAVTMVSVAQNKHPMMRGGNQAVIAVQNNNVLYEGVENRVSMAVFGAMSEDVEMVILKGEAKIEKESGISYKIFAPKKGMVTVGVRNKKTHQMVTTMNLQVVAMPEPVVMWGKCEANSVIDLNDALHFEVVAMQNTGAANQQTYKPKSIKAMIIGGAPAKKIAGTRLDEEFATLLKKEVMNDAKRHEPKGVKVYIEFEVNVNGTTKNLGAVYTVKMMDKAMPMPMKHTKQDIKSSEENTHGVKEMKTPLKFVNKETQQQREERQKNEAKDQQKKEKEQKKK